MDRAVGLLTVDTMTLHLAAACRIPYIAYTRSDGQSGSIPKGNCVANIGYSKVHERMGMMLEIVKSWAR
jgi:ADP-heptose:LPS heptosyltransferase